MLFIGTDQCLCSILQFVLSLRLLSALIPYHSLVKFKHFSFCLLYILILARNLNQQPLYIKKILTVDMYLILLLNWDISVCEAHDPPQ